MEKEPSVLAKQISIHDLAFPSCLCNKHLEVLTANDSFNNNINVKNLLDYLSDQEKLQEWIEKVKNGEGIDSTYFQNINNQYVLVYCSYYKNDTYLFNFIKTSDTQNQRMKDLHDAFIFDKVMTLEKIQALREEINLKNKLISIISHDIKNQLNTFQLLDEDMLQEIQEKCTAYTAHKFELVYQVCDAFVYYVNNLLNWIKANNKNIQVNFEDVDLYEVLTNVVEINKVHSEKKHISIIFSSLCRTKIYSDVTILTTIFVNILNNAIKFSKLNSNIFITLLDLRDTTEIIFQDNGVGIPPEQLENIFEPKKIMSTPGTIGEKGTGFGLILVKEFLNFIDGQIFIESKVNVGTKVIIRLPKNNKPERN
ncbi:MAG TPA: HAMP domain-containing sensor histidine kinase [Ignavibacteriales bacterium]|nr:HAMP domain-containing sensor histidine kinase [Ignavibacteriales bacterium]HOL80413.1 HAMP domain-containing sensor histidine kinase [Ignavibacteriales bacterium]HOM64864.1 HAMP domain-containing sensor histidine kinase [Ignavibacteriales bacterium]HPD67403.1 HAMP domain-containing sensor histidine kinase [Ignavibacteriales bacterium]HPP32602.1 HAMP domain-containing sensor histidine kinase [Ignavibacteriales bacterium]